MIRERKGVILPVVLIILLMLGIIAASFSFHIHSEASSTQALTYRLQTRLAAEAGIEKVKLALRSGRVDMSTWYNNPDEWHRIIVWAKEGDELTWGSNDEFLDGEQVPAYRFSLVADDFLDDEEYLRFGITDESSKLNLNMATEEQLLLLVTAAVGEGNEEIIPQDIVNAILDWRDEDSDPRGEDGDTEGEYYRTLKPRPYEVKNGPFDTVEELLLVKGVTGQILYGEDWDRNGLVSTNEEDGDESFPPDNEDEVLNLGLYPYLTVHSVERDVANDNSQRASLQGDEQAVRAALEGPFEDDPSLIDFVVSQMGAFKSSNGDGNGDGGDGADGEGDGGENDGIVIPGGRNGRGESAGRGGRRGGDGERSGGSGDSNRGRRPRRGGSGVEPFDPGSGEFPGSGSRREERGTGRGPRGGRAAPFKFAANKKALVQESTVPFLSGLPLQAQPEPEGGDAENDGKSLEDGDGTSPEDGSDGDNGGDGGDHGNGGADGEGSENRYTSPAVLLTMGTNNPLTVADLPVLMDKLTVHQPNTELSGLININTAPRLVLKCVPGLTDEQISAIIETRDSLEAETKMTTAWLVTEEVIDLETYVEIAPLITARGQQFTVQALGYGDHMGMVTRIEVVIDMMGPLAQTIYYRDISHLGASFPIREEDLEDIRAAFP